MTRKEFKSQYREHDTNSALTSLLLSQKDNVIKIPVGLFRLSDPDGLNPTGTEEELIEFLESGESTEVSFKNDNNHEAYIAEIRLEDDNVRIKVYDYYRSEFYDVDPYRLICSKDAVDFALEYGNFDDNRKKLSPAELSDNQLDLLDEFVAAARRLNDAGVSLFWNDDDNALAVANRDAMRDCDFFERDNEEIASNPDAESVYDNLTASLEVEINYISEEQDYLFFPPPQKKN